MYFFPSKRKQQLHTFDFFQIAAAAVADLCWLLPCLCHKKSAHTSKLLHKLCCVELNLIEICTKLHFWCSSICTFARPFPILENAGASGHDLQHFVAFFHSRREKVKTYSYHWLSWDLLQVSPLSGLGFLSNYAKKYLAIVKLF